MSEPFLAEIKMVGFNFAPRGWAFCDGALLPINQHQSVYSLLGTNFGGDGRTTFGLPDLRGRTPVHKGSADSWSTVFGQKGGEERHTLLGAEIPGHTHTLRAHSGLGDVDEPGSTVVPARAADDVYGAIANSADMGAASAADAGGGQAHETMQPYLALNFCIALQGLFPSR